MFKRLTPEQVNGGVSNAHCDRFGAGDPRATARYILSSHAEQPFILLHQHVLTVSQEGETAAIKGHIMWVTCGYTYSGTY